MNVRSSKAITLPYSCIRNISSPEDTNCGRRVLAGQIPIASIVDIPTNENVREYLLEAEGKLRRRPTQVHRAILETLRNNAENFSVLNSGLVIVAREAKIDDKNFTVTLSKSSIINGSQTQGVVRDFIKDLTEKNEDIPEIHVKFELIVTDDDDLIAETSIARNFQNDVMAISIIGRLGQLDELEKAIQKERPGTKLRMSETQLSDDYVDTEKLLQVLIALIPPKLWPNESEQDDPNKVFAYSQKTKCLKFFQDIHVKATEEKDEASIALYKFFLDMAPTAYDLYHLWKSHQGFQGSRLWSIQREGREIIDIPDGIIFPILASLSAFMKKSGKNWKYSPPDIFNDEEVVKAAKQAYQQIAKSNPQTMGKNKACYSMIYQITSLYSKLS
jgi:hypothetical protein